MPYIVLNGALIEGTYEELHTLPPGIFREGSIYQRPISVAQFQNTETYQRLIQEMEEQHRSEEIDHLQYKYLDLDEQREELRLEILAGHIKGDDQAELSRHTNQFVIEDLTKTLENVKAELATYGVDVDE